MVWGHLETATRNRARNRVSRDRRDLTTQVGRASFVSCSLISTIAAGTDKDWAGGGPEGRP